VGKRPAVAEAIKSEATRIGFELVGIAPAGPPDSLEHFNEWLRCNYDGEMGYLKRRRDAYDDPGQVLDGTVSLVMLGMIYRSRTEPPLGSLPGEGLDRVRPQVPATVSRYATGTHDYHAVLRDRLRTLGDFVHDRLPGCRTRGIVDTAPLLERDFARRAGLGWFGKNTMLLNRQQGSWFFLAALLVDRELEPDPAHDTNHCGTCTLCLEACPTDAFPEPYVLDARRCISYLTIETRDAPVPRDLRSGIGDWLFGCDICQDVCPWNRDAPASGEPAFEPRPDLLPADAVELLSLDEATFSERFEPTPLERPGRVGLVRNAAIVTGNAGDPVAVPPLVNLLDDDSDTLRGTAAWALGRIGTSEAVSALRARRAVENNGAVIEELDAALRDAASRRSTA